MGKIQILSDHIINQIAAGEVVERPAAVVKELIENSIDSGANRIEVQFRNGGKDYIRIEDNGCGMTSDEALLALERHATSKIRDIHDLEKIHSLGFRGEALPSIASVSRLTIKTRLKESDCGCQIVVDAGKVLERKDYGMPQGTVIEVLGLFHNLPARRKFLKTDNTEAAHIIQLVRVAAITRPEIAFSLVENERTLFRSPSCKRLIDRVGEIFGSSKTVDLLNLEKKQGTDFFLHGLISKPGTGRATRNELITIINGRPVESRTLSYAVVEAYHTLIPKGRYPVVFLFLKMDPAMVDVNVHPAKREVRFRNEGIVRQFIIETLLERLRKVRHKETPSNTFSSDSSYVPLPPKTPIAKTTTAGLNDSREKIPPDNTAPITSRLFPESSAIKRRAVLNTSPTIPSQSCTTSGPSNFTPYSPNDASQLLENQSYVSWTFLGWMAQDYALFETAEADLIVFCPLHAERRIIFERLKKQLTERKNAIQQPLLFPFSIELEPLSVVALENHRDSLEAIGFSVEPFGRQTFRIEALPDWIEVTKAKYLLEDLIAHFREGGSSRTIPMAHESLARIASKHVKRRKNSAQSQDLKKIVSQLLSCENPLTEPNGKPTFFEITAGELRKKFGI